MAREYFSSLMGAPTHGRQGLRMESLNLGHLPPDLAQGLEAPFTDEEVKGVVMDMPSDRAPGPDGFTCLFFKVCWDIISSDLMAVMKDLHDGKFYSFGGLNNSILTLLPKKANSLEIGDSRPINLIHGAAKIFAKVLAVRLAPQAPAVAGSNLAGSECIRHEAQYS